MKQNTNSDDPADMRQNNPVSGDVADVATLLERAYLFLEDGAWEKADEYCEKILDRDPDNVQAYLGKLLSSLHCHTLEQLSKLDTSFEENEHYKKSAAFCRSGTEGKDQGLRVCGSKKSDINGGHRGARRRQHSTVGRGDQTFRADSELERRRRSRRTVPETHGGIKTEDGSE